MKIKLLVCIPVLITGLIPLISGCTPYTNPPTTVEAQIDPAAVFTANCAICHGAARTGTSVGPNITPPFLTTYTEATLAAFISSHQTGPTLPAADWPALAAYLINTQ
ncbi:c-type cytochrome [Dehalogenimonas etheniformans]|uniref:c-type cytochrome n=1 Tax=Dehalogenimonas etheniformans TaxID=1536648 RepID=UPI00167F5E30|nr:cytochrome c [Dehalogenimonas etheniformans]QNT76203.1 cytochrome c [Dehalogenimonas etheniformans]